MNPDIAARLQTIEQCIEEQHAHTEVLQAALLAVMQTHPNPEALLLLLQQEQERIQLFPSAAASEVSRIAMQEVLGDMIRSVQDAHPSAS